MLDLNRLAELRAEALKQSSESWRRALWSAQFQKLIQSLSDGEVESFIETSTSAEHLLLRARAALTSAQ